MDGVNQNSQAQQAPAQNNSNQQNRNVSDKDANDFADKIKEQNKDKKADVKGDDKDQSLESLMAERRKSAKNAVEGRLKDQSKDDGRGEQHQQSKESLSDIALTKGAEAQIKTDMHVRETQQAASVKEVNAILQKMADQIHVSAKNSVNGAEIRLTLKDNILPGTEIRIIRAEGTLTVVMNTSSAEAGNFLAQHEASLQKTLAEKFAGEKIQVNINMSGGDNQDTDGRSRNQYVAEDEDQDNNN